jgi:type I restriction enzyme M protein
MVALKGKSDIGDKINTQIIQPLIDANAGSPAATFPTSTTRTSSAKGQAMVERLSNLIGIFQKPELDFSQNRAEHDDILGDAYEYLMRHFATESGKSKGQFYTPSEVSRVIAKVIGISPANTKAATTAYDPTCGSGSLLLKVAAEAGKHITLEGQEKDVTTAGLARMNMILHDFPTANILSGNTLAAPKFKDGEQLRTYDYVVANPPFSDKTWSTGLTPSNDPFQRFAWGEPPTKQGDYAYLLHIIRSLKSTGKGACILPHGVLFRGNAEAVIRRQLVRSGILKGIIGLPANLFYGTGIPACILVLDKENAAARKGVFMIDASKGFIKDGNKNRLREQDIHRIVDTFTRQADTCRATPAWCRFDEIADPKNDFNLNLPRYIDSTEPEDLQDIDGHLRGGIPSATSTRSARTGRCCPACAPLFRHAGRPPRLRPPAAAAARGQARHLRPCRIHRLQPGGDPALRRLARRRHAAAHRLRPGRPPQGADRDDRRGLLATFKEAPLLDAYDIYQHLMDYWAETMQDDAYLIAADGWVARTAASSRPTRRARPGQGLDLRPDPQALHRCALLRQGAGRHRGETGRTGSRHRQPCRAGRGARGEDAAFSGFDNINAAAVKERIREVARDPTLPRNCRCSGGGWTLASRSLAEEAQGIRSRPRPARLREIPDAERVTEIKTLVVDDKWMARISASRAGRTRSRLADPHRPHPRAGRTLRDAAAELTEEVARLAARVEEHLRRMGAVWK